MLFDEHDERWLRVWGRRTPIELLAEVLDAEPLEVQAFMAERGILQPAGLKRTAWTRAEDHLMYREYPNTSDALIAELLHRPVTAIATRAAKLGVYKSRAWLELQDRLAEEKRNWHRSRTSVAEMRYRDVQPAKRAPSPDVPG